jgi:photosystem II stability/assembly factor-like uncharacterized protein
MKLKYYWLVAAAFVSLFINAQDAPLKDFSPSALKWRSVGPALTSGRIADIAINPNDHSEYYVATAAGGVWKTTNKGVTYSPIFESQGSFSIGCVSIAPSNEHIVWVGSGENNNQRSVAYGDGVYKSLDGGKSWKNMGLKDSEHIGMIAIHPENANVVYVAAYGPLWSAGGDRGIYKTENGGESWKKVLDVSENTGFNEIHMDPRNPDVLYATAHQRRRHVWTYISGGSETALYKSTDGGTNWNKLENGLPSGEKGRIALAISPVNPDVVYAMVEESGVYRSTDRGASFSFMNDYNTSGNYYVELVAHPTELNTIYSMDTWMHASHDGGKSWERVPEKNKHVDNHCLWINPKDPQNMIAGCDGGLYETFDAMQNWHYKPNLPVTQFYKVTTDNAKPFYNIYGGTQDNFSLGGPSQTINDRGITNSDWIITNTGDGFESAIDPTDPNIVYAQSQYGGLVRFDRKSGEAVGIKPSPGKDEAAYRYNWDAPLLISPHNSKRLYFAANKVFRSDDRGDSWTVISNDLSQQIDRHTLPVMGKVWSVDAIAYDKSTTDYGNIVALDESPLKEGLLYAGTDDGLIHVSEDGGANWKKYASFPDVPKNTYVNMLVADKHDANSVYAVFNNHKNGDFKPYVFKSTNKGVSWKNISGDLPERGTAYCIAQDHVNPNLLFVGTEFSAFVSFDGGAHWKKLSAGLPTINVRDIAIQERENDLVIATMGRGFYVLDNYAPLREVNKELIKENHIFIIEDVLVYLEASPNGYGKAGFHGASYFFTENPEFGAHIYYNIKEVPKSKKALRQKAEKETTEKEGTLKYPSAEALRAEDWEEKNYMLFTISNEQGKEISRFTSSLSEGFNKVVWDGRISASSYLQNNGAPLTKAASANLALPGTYTIAAYMSIDGKVEPLNMQKSFELKSMNNSSLPASDKAVLYAFQEKLEASRRKLYAVNSFKKRLQEQIKKLKASARNTPGASLDMLNDLRQLEYDLYAIELELNGDQSLAKRQFTTAPSLLNRIGSAVWNSYYSTSAPTAEQKKNLSIVNEALPELLGTLKRIDDMVTVIADQLAATGAPYLEDQLPD